MRQRTERRSAAHPQDLHSVADSLRFSGQPVLSRRVLECADSWDGDRSIIEGLARANPIVKVGSWPLQHFVCVLCGEQSRSSITHATYCPWSLAAEWLFGLSG